jgi:hypothetical protein
MMAVRDALSRLLQKLRTRALTSKGTDAQLDRSASGAEMRKVCAKTNLCFAAREGS